MHSDNEWSGIPIIASNMDTVGTFEMAGLLSSFNIITAIHKHYTFDEWKSFIKMLDEQTLNNLAVSTGTGEYDENKLDTLLKFYPDLKFICIDVANGYSELFAVFVQALTRTAALKSFYFQGQTLLRLELDRDPFAQHALKPVSDIPSYLQLLNVQMQRMD